MKKLLIIPAFLLVGCAPTHHAYKVTFENGEVEYFNLTYKPKKGATSIIYEGDTILGVKTIESIDK